MGARGRPAGSALASSLDGGRRSPPLHPSAAVAPSRAPAATPASLRPPALEIHAFPTIQLSS